MINMFEKKDIVKFKNQTGKSYRQMKYLVVGINKGNGKVWVKPLERQQCFFWRLRPVDLVKVGHMK